MAFIADRIFLIDARETFLDGSNRSVKLQLTLIEAGPRIGELRLKVVSDRRGGRGSVNLASAKGSHPVSSQVGSRPEARLANSVRRALGAERWAIRLPPRRLRSPVRAVRWSRSLRAARSSQLIRQPLR